MAVLWAGGEDIDFSKGGTVSISTTAATFRSGYARCSIRAAALATYLQSLPFSGGAVTSCWLSFRFLMNGGTVWPTSSFFAGLVDSTTTASGLWLGISTGTTNKLALFTFDGTTKTQLAQEDGQSVTAVNATYIQRIDIQLSSYGATATVNVYCDGSLVITFTGDVTVGSVTAVDAVGVSGYPTSGSAFMQLTEFMVANEDPRAFPGLLTMALTGDGTTTDWTGTFSTINGTTISDANPNFTNTNDLDQEFDVTNLPTGTFTIRAIKLAMRAAKAAGTPTQIALGYNEGGTVTVESAIALTTAYATYEQLDTLNPRTSAAWDSSIINALQIDARSKA